ncbi:hypothetical protein [Nitriliruptor alkaliphilus]|uniref:hypothetical protein n=1 Tax=Nitriliruptor alkaliphilus TaxID=427918 RepID=UPI000696EC5E|nr:hypothetical protein [Nitriliruptor alkaliphilus]
MYPAPALLEVARIWWDVDRVPAVTWDAEGRCFDLVDPLEPSSRLRLVAFAAPVDDPTAIAAVLAEAFAACDFPPDGDGVPPARAELTVRAHGIRAPRPG